MDDNIFGSTKDELAHCFSSMMQTEFEMSMVGELNYFLGLQIWQSDLSIFISQYKYVKDLVKKFGLDFVSTVRTPMSPNVKLTVDLLGKSVDHFLYRSMIGSLLYQFASKPNISYSVGVCDRYQANPKEFHITMVKRIIKYIKSTSNFGVWYDKDTNDVLARYFDVDWAGNVDECKSTFDGCFYLGNNFVSWMSKKQNFISLSLSLFLSLSIAEVEYIIASSCCTQRVWMQKHLVMVFVKKISLYIVIVPVPLTSLKILFNILEPNTLRSDITLFMSWLKMTLSFLSSFTLMIKRLIF